MLIISFLGLILSSLNTHAEIKTMESCFSVEKREIKYFEKMARETGLKKKILIFSQIHGDEPQSGELAEAWVNRLEKIEPSNSWRIIPVLNPDGLVKKTRFNSNGVDLNRNFPTTDWESSAKMRWEKNEKSNPRRFPGKTGGSEPEVQCALAHIEEFKPDLIVSIHTPYGMFDFDGPLNKKLDTAHLLPWKRLGTFPGSLGRYMWDERKIPVLTIELKENSLIKNKKGFVDFQDLLSDLIP
jgi:protein MpaA